VRQCRKLRAQEAVSIRPLRPRYCANPETPAECAPEVGIYDARYHRYRLRAAAGRVDRLSELGIFRRGDGHLGLGDSPRGASADPQMICLSGVEARSSAPPVRDPHGALHPEDAAPRVAGASPGTATRDLKRSGDRSLSAGGPERRSVQRCATCTRARPCPGRIVAARQAIPRDGRRGRGPSGKRESAREAGARSGRGEGSRCTTRLGGPAARHRPAASVKASAKAADRLCARGRKTARASRRLRRTGD